jgi:hypothetical protein
MTWRALSLADGDSAPCAAARYCKPTTRSDPLYHIRCDILCQADFFLWNASSRRLRAGVVLRPACTL